MNIFNQDTLRERIKALKTTQAALARQSGVHQSNISKFLHGKTMTVATLEKLWPFLYGEQSDQKQAAGE